MVIVPLFLGGIKEAKKPLFLLWCCQSAVAVIPWWDDMTPQKERDMESLRNSYIIMEADLDSGAWLGAGDGLGREKPDTLLCVTVLGKVKVIHDLNMDSTMQIQLYLTPVHLARIILSYFEEVRVFRFLRRALHSLLKKRWQVMTSPIYKKHFDDCEDMKYYKIAA